MILKEFLEHYPGRSFVWGEAEEKVMLHREWDYVKRPNEVSPKEWDTQEVIDRGWALSLPHQCDDWVIGSPEVAEQMIAAMQAAIQYAREQK